MAVATVNKRFTQDVVGPVAGAVAVATIVSSVLLGPGQSRYLRVLGAVIGIAALPLAFLPIVLLVRRGQPPKGKSYLYTSQLVDTGLYGVVRHPQYLAYILFMFAFCLLAQQWVVTGLALLACALLYMSAVLEESACATKFGAQYVEYTQRVPRFNLFLGIWRRLRRSGT